MTSQSIFFSWKSCDFPTPLINEVFMLSGQQLENSDHICFWEQLALRQKAVPTDYLASHVSSINSWCVISSASGTSESIFCFVWRINSLDTTGITYKLPGKQVTWQTNFFRGTSCDFPTPLINEAGHGILSAIGEPGPCLLWGTIGIETKSSTYGLPGKLWDLAKFPRKLSTIAPAPVKVDAWSGVQIEQLSNLGQALGKSFEIPGRWWHHRQYFLWKSCDVPAPLIKEVFWSSGHH